jgi:hypothetical protein
VAGVGSDAGVRTGQRLAISLAMMIAVVLTASMAGGAHAGPSRA